MILLNIMSFLYQKITFGFCNNPLTFHSKAGCVKFKVIRATERSSFRNCLIYLDFARAMEQTPVSCLPTNAKMSKAKKVLEEAREFENPELDLFDKGVSTFEEMPGLRKCF